jgi:hypothetical protein
MGASEVPEGNEIDPNPAMRALWLRLAHPTSREDMYAAFAELDQLGAHGGGVEVIQQGLALAAEDLSAKQMLIPAVYVPKLGLWANVVLAAAVPMLDSARPAQREEAELLLKGLLSSQPPWIDDRDLRDYLRERAPEPPLRFVELLLSVSPHAGLLALNAALPENDRHRAIDWADHVVADAIWKQEHDFVKPEDTSAALAELDKLAKLDEWWARLYVAEVMNKHRFLRDGKLVERLKQDKHESVRRAAQRAQ